ncbi:hypothetical protein V1J52_20625 [Streptomyces sp. TRM 70351]|uniref:hypothetical protein n=1 Tax=Streptomyces sp. TRM 70351 TaxID=3116552 RepID=UPI002E7B9B0B|nr:hypothetical protein [Streptomyces sp. TRM 70351]MEE1930562.1 hypothetical protein [Streptomyces sp. TRM 70351]
MADTHSDDTTPNTTGTAEPEAPAADARAARQAAKLAKSITAFAQRHGGSAEGQLAYVGQRGVRISLVAEDGTWGDLMAPSHAIAERAVARAGITVRETFDGEMAARVRTGPYEWSRMAGSQLGGPANP